MDSIVTATDSYLSTLLGNTNITPITMLTSFFLIIARLLPIMLIVPFFGGKILHGTIKVMFSVSICSIFLPQIVVSLKTDIPFDLAYIGYAIKELTVGFIIGLLATIPFYVAQSTGSLIDHIRGSSSLQVTDPTTSTQTGPIGQLYNYVLIAIFFIIGGPFIFFDVLNQSFQVIPINGLINPLFFTLKLPFWQLAISLVNYVLSFAIQLGAPSFIGVLMAEMFLGIANRLAPQVQIVFLGISLKSWVGLALLAAAWYFIMNQLGKESLAWLNTIQNTINQTIIK